MSYFYSRCPSSQVTDLSSCADEKHSFFLPPWTFGTCRFGWMWSKENKCSSNFYNQDHSAFSGDSPSGFHLRTDNFCLRMLDTATSQNWLSQNKPFDVSQEPALRTAVQKSQLCSQPQSSCPSTPVHPWNLPQAHHHSTSENQPVWAQWSPLRHGDNILCQ